MSHVLIFNSIGHIRLNAHCTALAASPFATVDTAASHSLEPIHSDVLPDVGESTLYPSFVITNQELEAYASHYATFTVESEEEWANDPLVALEAAVSSLTIVVSITKQNAESLDR